MGLYLRPSGGISYTGRKYTPSLGRLIVSRGFAPLALSFLAPNRKKEDIPTWCLRGPHRSQIRGLKGLLVRILKNLSSANSDWFPTGSGISERDYPK